MSYHRSPDMPYYGSKLTRFETILKNFRRRDNIRDFISGLQDTECWPYPAGEEHPIPATFEDWEGPTMVEAKLREEKVHELVCLYLINVQRYHPLAPFFGRGIENGEVADVSVELCPEEGPGAYAVDYEVVDRTERSEDNMLNTQEAATIRSAFMHRHDWVISKLQSVNRDRVEAWEDAKIKPEVEPEIEEPVEAMDCENEVEMSEEEDFDYDVSLPVGAHRQRSADPHRQQDRSGEMEVEDPEDDAMDEEGLLVVVKPYLKLSQKPGLSTRVDPYTQLGCAPAYGPSAKTTQISADMDNETDFSGTTVNAQIGSDLSGFWRDSTRELSPEL